MDEELSVFIKGGEQLPDTDKVYRIVLVTNRDRKNRNIPSIGCFSLAPTDEGSLSVDWERKTSPEESIARFGASYKLYTKEYKPYENREIYALDVSFLCSLTDVDKVIYDPIYFPKPIKGRVNNPAHSLVKFSEIFTKNNDPETILKIRNHATEKKVPVDIERVHELVKELRF